jgi:transcriptional regulator with XRE-family HTH domain
LAEAVLYVRDIRVGQELRRLRLAAGMDGEKAARLLRWSPSKISRLERARNAVALPDLGKLLRVYGVPGDQAQALTELARSLAQSRVLGRSRPDSEDPLHIAEAERAGSVLEHAVLAVPRLLQTPGYALALLESQQPVTRLSPESVRDMAAGVMRWQLRLAGDHPAAFRAIIDEAVLYRAVGGRDVMAAQLRHLAGTQAEVRVLPLDGAPVGIGAFTVLEFPALQPLATARAVLLEGVGSTVREDDQEQTWGYRITFDNLWLAAEPPERALKQAMAALDPALGGGQGR